MIPHIVLTRPIVQSQRFAAELSAVIDRAAEIITSPLLRIQPLEFEAMPADRDVIFTSENGVSGFVARADVGVRKAYCVGDRTAEAAREAGFEAYSASGTSTDLIELIARDGGGEMIYARGENVARNLSADLAAIGIPVQEVLVYAQEPMGLSDEVKSKLKGSARLIFPLFSTRSMELLGAQGIGEGSAKLSAVCISKGVARSAPPGCFSDVVVCDAPNSRAMIESLRSLVA